MVIPLSLAGFSPQDFVLAEERNSKEQQKEDTEMSDSPVSAGSQVSQASDLVLQYGDLTFPIKLNHILIFFKSLYKYHLTFSWLAYLKSFSDSLYPLSLLYFSLLDLDHPTYHTLNIFPFFLSQIVLFCFSIPFYTQCWLMQNNPYVVCTVILLFICETNGSCYRDMILL